MKSSKWLKVVVIVAVCAAVVVGAIALINTAGSGGNAVSDNISQVHSSMHVNKVKDTGPSFTVAEGNGAGLTIADEAVPLANPKFIAEYEALKKDNENAAGLIRVESVGIEEPVLLGGDNVDVIKAMCESGPDVLAAGSWDSGRVSLYGGSAFGALRAYEDEAFCMGNAYFEVNQAGTPTRWQVFAVTQTEADTLGKMKAGALFSTGAIVLETNSLMTLAVCGGDALYIHAKEVSW